MTNGSRESTVPVTFRTMTDASSEECVVEMMAGLYREDPPQKPVDPDSFRRTVRRFLDHPDSGRLIEFWSPLHIVGYAIIVPYWSNELGGTLAFLDELYVIPEARRRGIATAFLESLRKERPFDAALMMLEASPGNLHARRLYAALGFEKRKNETFIWPLTAAENS